MNGKHDIRGRVSGKRDVTALYRYGKCTQQGKIQSVLKDLRGADY